MTAPSRVYANLATLANALVGVGAIGYAWAGNPLWAVLLIVSGLGFDGLDGYLARRGNLPPSLFGRVADSVADAITFGAAPAVLIGYHSANVAGWSALAPWTTLVAAAIAGLAVVRLTYFTLTAFHEPFFIGAPTPQTALAIGTGLLLFDVPGVLGVDPGAALGIAAVAALLMVAPIRFPKIRRGALLRLPMTVTAVALVAAVLPFQFRPARGSLPYDLAAGLTLVSAAGLIVYYLVGPFSVRASTPPPSSEVHRA
ncbi:MAG: CDP-alcohol phosphatidyltransferase family protein [Thermoplasmata archaeon]